MDSDADFNALPAELEERMKRKRAQSRTDRAQTDPSANIRRWGPYELVEEAGEGPTARVYRARRAGDGRDLAVKILRRAVVEGAQTAGARADFLLGNASTITALSHPNLVDVLSIELHDGKTGMVMPWVEGPTLDERLRGRAILSVPEALQTGSVLCGALSAVHSSGLLHNDLKARNIVFTELGPTLMDLSSACEFGTDRGDRGIALSGSPQFMAPELLHGGTPNESSDVYALGVVLFLAMSGRYPLRGPMVSQLRDVHDRGEQIRLHELMPEIPGAVIDVVERTLSKDPAKRPASPRELADELDALASVDFQELQLRERGALVRWWSGLHGGIRAAIILTAVALFILLLST
jgi:serine/threonine-protein kinase